MLILVSKFIHNIFINFGAPEIVEPTIHIAGPTFFTKQIFPKKQCAFQLIFFPQLIQYICSQFCFLFIGDLQCKCCVPWELSNIITKVKESYLQSKRCVCWDNIQQRINGGRSRLVPDTLAAPPIDLLGKPNLILQSTRLRETKVRRILFPT